MAPDYHWEYRASPYRGVLVPAHRAGNGRTRAYTAYIETPQGRVPAPQLFPAMDAAQHWVEQHIDQLLHPEHDGSGN